MAFYDRGEFLPLALIDGNDDWISPYDFFNPRSLILQSAFPRNYLRRWRHQVAPESGTSNVINDKNEFKINLDVQQFKPEEIQVKVVDNAVVIEGKHEERRDEHGFISRQFQRRYLLPKDVNPQAVVSNLSSDGVLSVSAPKVDALPGNERKIPITHTNQPAVKNADKGKGKMEKMEQ